MVKNTQGNKSKGKLMLTIETKQMDIIINKVNYKKAKDSLFIN